MFTCIVKVREHEKELATQRNMAALQNMEGAQPVGRLDRVGALLVVLCFHSQLLIKASSSLRKHMKFFQSLARAASMTRYIKALDKNPVLKKLKTSLLDV